MVLCILPSVKLYKICQSIADYHLMICVQDGHFIVMSHSCGLSSIGFGNVICVADSGTCPRTVAMLCGLRSLCVFMYSLFSIKINAETITHIPE